MPNEAPYGHGCPPEPVAGKASKYQKHGPESAKQGRGRPPGDKVPKQGNKTLAAANKVSPRQWLQVPKRKTREWRQPQKPIRASGYSKALAAA